MKKLIINIVLSAILSTVLLIPSLVTSPAYAENSLSEAKFNVREILRLPGEGEQPTKYFNDAKYSPIVAFIIRIIDFATRIIGSIAIILFIVAGFIFMLSTGNQQRLDKAKDIAVFAIIGLIVTFFAYLITIFIQSVFISAPPTT